MLKSSFLILRCVVCVCVCFFGLISYIGFGWGEFTRDGKHRKENLSKTVFFTIWQAEENRKGGKRGRKFSLPGPKISSSQIGRKSLERKCSHSTLTIIPHSGIKYKKKKKQRERER